MKALLLSLPVSILAACGPAPLTSVPSISGQLAPRTPWPDAVSFNPIVLLPQMPAPVAADGTFDLPLPAALAPDGTHYGSPLCSGEVRQSDIRAEFATLPEGGLRLWQRGEPVGSVTTRRVADGAVSDYQYVYSSLPTTVRGTQICDGVRETFELDYWTGWNLVEWTQAADRSFVYRSVPNRRLLWASRH